MTAIVSRQPRSADEARPRVAEGSILTKTKLCDFHASGYCHRGASCTYAHGKAELKPMPDLFKTRCCTEFFRRGACPSGNSCKFAHSREERRAAVIPRRGGGSEAPKHAAGQMAKPWQPRQQQSQQQQSGQQAAPHPQQRQQKPAPPKAPRAPRRRDDMEEMQAQMLLLKAQLQALQAQADGRELLDKQHLSGASGEKFLKGGRSEVSTADDDFMPGDVTRSPTQSCSSEEPEALPQALVAEQGASEAKELEEAVDVEFVVKSTFLTLVPRACEGARRRTHSAHAFLGRSAVPVSSP